MAVYLFIFAFIFILNVWATVFDNTYNRFIENQQKKINKYFHNFSGIVDFFLNTCKSEPEYQDILLFCI